MNILSFFFSCHLSFFEDRFFVHRSRSEILFHFILRLRLSLIVVIVVLFL